VLTPKVASLAAFHLRPKFAASWRFQWPFASGSHTVPGGLFSLAAISSRYSLASASAHFSVQACSISLSVNGTLLLGNGDGELLGLLLADFGDCSLLLTEPRLDPEASTPAS
jgi:hypothetical protein